MKKFLQSLSSVMCEDKTKCCKEKLMGFVAEHPEIFCFSLLAICCLVFLFFGLGMYPLIDVDETRYAVMSRDMLHSMDWNSLMLNGVPFLEKPPLYFWLVAVSIKLFGGFSSFAVRFPIALLSSGLVFFTYYLGKRVLSRKFGMLSALILLSSIFYLILAHVAIIDMVLTVFMTSSLYCFLWTYFCEERYKKYNWWLFYTLAGAGFLAKGLLAIAIPAVIILIYAAFTKTLKEIFKPINFVPGLVLFLAIILPWHLIMLGKYGFEFIKQYFLLHHFARFINSETIGRERPLLYFIPVFLMGFMPWTLVFIAFLWDGVKKLFVRFKTAEGKFIDKVMSLFATDNNERKLMVFAVIAFVVIFAVFSSSSTKLPTYILPAFPFAALLTGYYWWVNEERDEHTKAIYNSTLILALVLMVASIGFIIAYNFFPLNLQGKFSSFKDAGTIGLCLSAVLLALRGLTKKTLSVFLGYIVTMMFIIILSVTHIFNFVYSTGENEIVDFSEYSSVLGHKAQLVTFDFAVKPSVMMKSDAKIVFVTDPDFNKLDELLQYKSGPTFVIVKNKNFEGNDKYLKAVDKRLNLVKTGERYSLYEKKLKK